MRISSMMIALCVLLLAPPVFAQEWAEYTNTVDRFTVPAPGQPKVETIAWNSEYGGKFPGRVYRWEQGRNRYSVTVVDYSDSERIHSELNHIAYQGGPGPGGVYWLVDIVSSVAYAATKYRQQPGVKVTYDAFHYIEFVTGLELQLTNPDDSRTYAGIYLHENRLYILDATVPRGEAPPIIFQQSFGFLDAAGNPVRYRPFYVNPLPAPRLGQGGGGATPR
jgi:hypothetical protein